MQNTGSWCLRAILCLNENEWDHLNTTLRCDNFFVFFFFSTLLIFRFSLWHAIYYVFSFCHLKQFFFHIMFSLSVLWPFRYGNDWYCICLHHTVRFEMLFVEMKQFKYATFEMRLFFFSILSLFLLPTRNSTVFFCCFFIFFFMCLCTSWISVKCFVLFLAIFFYWR